MNVGLIWKGVKGKIRRGLLRRVMFQAFCGTMTPVIPLEEAGEEAKELFNAGLAT